MERILAKIKSSEYNKNILSNILSAFVVKGGAVIVGILIVSAYMSYFDDTAVLGLWYTLLSLFQSVVSFDLGIGNGLRNKLAETVAKGDHGLAKKYISSAYVALGAFSILMILVCQAAVQTVPWNAVFNIGQEAVSPELLALCMRIVCWGLGIQFVLKNITSVLYALQKSALTNLMALLSNMLILMYAFFAPKGSSAANLVALVIFNMAAVNLPLLAATVIVFATKLKDCRPAIRSFSRKAAQEIFKMGMCFFWLQLMIMFISSMNEILITYFTKPAYVVEYQIYFRLFQVSGTVFSLALLPIWSAVTKARTENNIKWIDKLHDLLMILAGVAAMAGFLLIPFLQWIINLWLGEKAITVSYTTALVFAVSNALLIWHSANANIANGLGYLRPQMIFLTLASLLKIPASFLLVNALHSWVGVIFANIIVLIPITVIQPVWLKKYIRETALRCYGEQGTTRRSARRRMSLFSGPG